MLKNKVKIIWDNIQDFLYIYLFFCYFQRLKDAFVSWCGTRPAIQDSIFHRTTHFGNHQKGYFSISQTIKLPKLLWLPSAHFGKTIFFLTYSMIFRPSVQCKAWVCTVASCFGCFPKEFL